MMKTPLQFIKELIYHLKMDYGVPAYIYHKGPEISDVTTGRVIVSIKPYKIRRAIQLPTVLSRTLFAQGALKIDPKMSPLGFDIEQKLIIVDNKDLPDNVEFTLNDYFVILHKRFDIKTVEETEDRLITLFITKEIKGAEVNEIYQLSVSQTLTFTQTVV